MARTDPRPHYGTKRRVGVNGYVDIFEPAHPLARSDGYVSEHRKVAWDSGVLVDPKMQVHHINGDKQDNRIQNLQVVTASEHASLHWERERPRFCPNGHEFTEENTGRVPQGWRYCKQCNRNRQAALRRRGYFSTEEQREKRRAQERKRYAEKKAAA